MALTDPELVAALEKTVTAIDGVLFVLADTDPLDLKNRDDDCQLTGVATWVLDTAHWPGTDSWDEFTADERADWWVNRIGALTTAAVAFPGMFGMWSRLLPLSDWLGFAGQALVLRAVARESGATSRAVGVVMLAKVLFDRDVSEIVAGVDDTVDADDDAGVVERTWRIGKTLYDMSNSLGARPSMPKFIGWGTWLPFLGGPLTYLGERIALRRAVAEATDWISTHPGVHAG